MTFIYKASKKLPKKYIPLISLHDLVFETMKNNCSNNDIPAKKEQILKRVREIQNIENRLL